MINHLREKKKKSWSELLALASASGRTPIDVSRVILPLLLACLMGGASPDAALSCHIRCPLKALQGVLASVGLIPHKIPCGCGALGVLLLPSKAFPWLRDFSAPRFLAEIPASKYFCSHSSPFAKLLFCLGFVGVGILEDLGAAASHSQLLSSGTHCLFRHTMLCP